MAFIITTKSVIVASFVAAAGGGAGMAGHHAHRGEVSPAPAYTASTLGQAAAGPDWSGQWYSVQRTLRVEESAAGEAPSF